MPEFQADQETSMEIGSKDGIIKIPEKKWKRMLAENKGSTFSIDIYAKNSKGEWSKYKTVTNKIASDPVDPYITYRLLVSGLRKLGRNNYQTAGSGKLP